MSMQKVEIEQFDRAYFIGVGGIGMSALARYFNFQGWRVAGYDKTSSPLIDELISEGIEVHFDDLGDQVHADLKDKKKTLVVYTPAVPKDHAELNYFQSNDFVVMKRAQVLGMITRNSKALGVAGTHGKTTTSTMLAHMLNESSLGCNAFLGGIATNFNSNFVHHPSSEWTVVESDEFDRSFLQLSPFASIVTSTDADHLDIYGDDKVFKEGFQAYVDLIDKNGVTVVNKDVDLNCSNAITYGIDVDADYSGTKIRFENGKFLFDVNTPNGLWEGIELGIPGIHNAENAIACIALTLNIGLTEQEIRSSLKSFKGVKRRFEYHVREVGLVYIDDYAHHPTELKALIDSVRLLYPDKEITGVFQPHLFSRTRDFFDGFVRELSRLDELILLPIYPARELPIEGVSSDALLEQITAKRKMIVSKDKVVDFLASRTSGVYLTIGAGDIDRIIPQLKEVLSR